MRVPWSMERPMQSLTVNSWQSCHSVPYHTLLDVARLPHVLVHSDRRLHTYRDHAQALLRDH